MIIKLKKGTAYSLILSLVFMAVITASFVYAACTNTETYTLILYDPDSNQISSGSEIIDPIDGTNCDSATANTETGYATCTREGSYTAEITCAGCSTHSAISATSVLNCTPSNYSKFVLRNHSGGAAGAFNELGYLYLRGTNTSNVASISPPKNSFIVKDSAGTVVAYIDQLGNLVMAGDISTFQTITTAPKNSFVIQNSTGKVVSYIDSSGNVVLTGGLYSNWEDKI